MKVLLLSPPYKSEYMRNGRCDYFSISHAQWLPVWLSYAGALLEREGHMVRLIDAPPLGLDHKKTFREIVEFLPDMLVVYGATKSQKNDIIFSESIKEKVNCNIVFVGPFASIDPKVILEHSEKIDCAIKGEFEYPLLQLANGRKRNEIDNLFWRNNGEITENKERPPLKRQELDSLPFVASFYKKHIDFRNYKLASELHPFIDLFTGRGCFWGRCTFCLWPHSFIKGAVYNTRSIENVLNEIKFIKKEMPSIKEIFIQDDTLPKGRALELSEAILGSNLDITWSCYVRGNLDYEILKIMKRSGCRSLHVGYESANVSILKNVHKGISVGTMAEFTRNAKRLGLRIHGDFLLGLPGETENTIRETIRWAKSLDPETAQFLIAIPYNSTPYSNYLKGCNNRLNLSERELNKWRKLAYRRFYIRWKFVKKALFHPYEYIFSQARAILRMIGNIY